MKKKLLLRGALGFPIGIAIGYVITICISLMWAGGYYSPCAPELAEALGNEISAVIPCSADCWARASRQAP